MSTISKQFKVDGTLTDVTSAVLSDPTSAYGVKRNDTDAVVVADGTAMTKQSTGVYSHSFDDPADDLVYTYYIEAVYEGATYQFSGTLTGPKSGIISVSLLKDWLGVSGTDEDTQIEDIRDGVTVECEEYCGRKLVSESVTTILDGQGGHNIYLYEPAESITSVYESSDQAWTSTYLTDSDDYMLMPQNGYLRNRVHKPSHSWLDANAAVRVTFEAGIATPPQNLVQAVSRECAIRYQAWLSAKQGNNILDAQKIETWQQKYKHREGLDAHTKEVLDNGFVMGGM